MLSLFICLTAITYRFDVKPILEKRCTQCHGEKWLSYTTAFNNKQLIKNKVWDIRTMPPGGMTMEERRLIRDWVNQGAIE